MCSDTVVSIVFGGPDLFLAPWGSRHFRKMNFLFFFFSNWVINGGDYWALLRPLFFSFLVSLWSSQSCNWAGLVGRFWTVGRQLVMVNIQCLSHLLHVDRLYGPHHHYHCYSRAVVSVCCWVQCHLFVFRRPEHVHYSSYSDQLKICQFPATKTILNKYSDFFFPDCPHHVTQLYPS